jgi:hypothetical protein
MADSAAARAHTHTRSAPPAARSMGQLEARSKRAEALGAEFGEAVEGTRGRLGELGQVSASASAALGQALQRVLEQEGQELAAMLRSLKGDVGLMAEEGGAAARRVGQEMCARLTKEVLEVGGPDTHKHTNATQMVLRALGACLNALCPLFAVVAGAGQRVAAPLRGARGPRHRLPGER